MSRRKEQDEEKKLCIYIKYLDNKGRKEYDEMKEQKLRVEERRVEEVRRNKRGKQCKKEEEKEKEKERRQWVGKDEEEEATDEA